MTELELAHAMLIFAEEQMLNLCGYKKMLNETMFDNIIREIVHAQELEAKANAGDEQSFREFVNLTKTFDEKIRVLFHSKPEKDNFTIEMKNTEMGF